ncbi:hypothetical protein A3Q56_04280 [Intoshia linei]|uniref:Uncharacterized protein n=1 Tax=Intoshia linei TaxID=1819745 RepID=A0A177B1K0_9BILA|nr:hypothetical protein A3Q56_04280 [Intoshia linei]
MFAMVGPPKLVHTNNEKEFKNSEVTLMQSIKCRYRSQQTARHPQSSRAVCLDILAYIITFNANLTLKRWLAKTLDCKNTISHRSTNKTPISVFMGCQGFTELCTDINTIVHLYQCFPRWTLLPTLGALYKVRKKNNPSILNGNEVRSRIIEEINLDSTINQENIKLNLHNERINVTRSTISRHVTFDIKRLSLIPAEPIKRYKKDDYKKCFQLFISILRRSKDKLLKPVATSKARWMCRMIYAIKTYSLNVDRSESMLSFFKFTMYDCIKVWMDASNSKNAYHNDV